jgi:uncharacterized membrane protein YdjX (TVP38/TMEM64 family)
MSYEFIKLNKDIILKYKSNNFLFLSTIFFIFSVMWVLFLGFATPLLILAGFVYGKWFGTLIIITSTTTGAALLYMLANYFFKETIKNKLEPKFSKLKILFTKNEVLYFSIFRFVGGGGMPYAVQNVFPVLFNMSVKNYMIATFLGSIPSMFIMVSLGSGIENIIDKNLKLTASSVLSSPDIYMPITGFFVIFIIAFIVKKFYFK